MVAFLHHEKSDYSKKEPQECAALSPLSKNRAVQVLRCAKYAKMWITSFRIGLGCSACQALLISVHEWCCLTSGRRRPRARAARIRRQDEGHP
ncbi:hypothetical protein ACQJBY_006810 [Aegilops geniculata]